MNFSHWYIYLFYRQHNLMLVFKIKLQYYCSLIRCELIHNKIVDLQFFFKIWGFRFDKNWIRQIYHLNSCSITKSGHHFWETLYFFILIIYLFLKLTFGWLPERLWYHLGECGHCMQNSRDRYWQIYSSQRSDSLLSDRCWLVSCLDFVFIERKTNH